MFHFTGGFAMALQAGWQGQVAFLDGEGRLYLFRDNGGFFLTPLFATRLSVGVDPDGNDELFFTDRSNRLHRHRGGTFSDTGRVAVALQASREGTAAFVDTSSILSLFQDDGSVLATQLSASRFSATRNSTAAPAVYFLGPGSVLHRLRQGQVTPLGFFAIDVVAC